MKNPNDGRRKAPPFCLIPAGPLARVAARYGLGAERYGRGTWRAGLCLDDAADHAMAHLLAHVGRTERFAGGERPDPRLEDDDLAALAWAALTLMSYQEAEGKEPPASKKSAGPPEVFTEVRRQRKGKSEPRKDRPAKTGGRR